MDKYTKKSNTNNNENESASNAVEEDDELILDKSLQCLRMEINTHLTVFLYYKIYPKADSKKFPQNLTAIFFYFDNENINEKFFKTYISLIGEIDTIEIGSYINRKGSKKKRKVVNFAIVKFLDEDSLKSLINRHATQMTINYFLEMKKNRNVQLSYDPLADEQDLEEEEADPEGFVTVKKELSKKRFSKNGLSFKVMKKPGEDGRKKIKVEEQKDFYWNFQLVDKKRKQYEELKNLFEQDKQAVQTNTNKKPRHNNNI